MTADGEAATADRCRRGRDMLNRGEYSEAVAELTEALRIDPELAEAYLLRGVALYHLRQFDRAIADCDEVIRRRPGHTGAYRGRAGAHLARSLLGDDTPVQV